VIQPADVGRKNSTIKPSRVSIESISVGQRIANISLNNDRGDSSGISEVILFRREVWSVFLINPKVLCPGRKILVNFLFH